MAAAAEAEAAAAVAAAPERPASRVLEALPELARLTAASGTLDGSLPLRAARACVPLVRANASGARVSLSCTLELRRRLGGLRASVPEEVRARHRALLPLLERAGLLPRALAERFAEGPARASGSRVELFTGLFVEVPREELLRVGNAGNRKPVTAEVREALFSGADGLVPLVLELSLAPGFTEAQLTGELASLHRLESCALRDATEPEARALVAAHAAFFDEAYFEHKKRGSTRKYAQRARRPTEGPAQGPAVRATLGPAHLEQREEKALTAAGRALPGAQTLTLRAAFSLSARWDGHTLTVTSEEQDRQRYNAAVEAAYRALSPEEKHAGARWYLSRYATLHQPGEPFFFVKAPALLRTPAGSSTLLAGHLGDGWETLTGLVDTDWFHALPAVFRVHRVGAVARVAAGAPLCTLYLSSRAALEGRFEATPWDPFA